MGAKNLIFNILPQLFVVKFRRSALPFPAEASKLYQVVINSLSEEWQTSEEINDRVLELCKKYHSAYLAANEVTFILFTFVEAGLAEMIVVGKEKLKGEEGEEG